MCGFCLSPLLLPWRLLFLLLLFVSVGGSP
jgi:hypothetical protein